MHGFEARVWESYITFRSLGYMYGSTTDLTERDCATSLQNSQMPRAGTKNVVPAPRVLWHGAYRTYRTYRYGYERHAELTEVSIFRGTGVHKSRKFRVGIKNAVPVPQELGPRVYRGYRSSGYTGMNVVQNLQKLLARV